MARAPNTRAIYVLNIITRGIIMQQEKNKNRISDLTRNIVATKGTKTVRLRIPIFDEIKRLSEKKNVIFTEYINQILLESVIHELEQEKHETQSSAPLE